MSEFVHVMVDVIGRRRKQVRVFTDSVATSRSTLSGIRVSRRWIRAAIDDPWFELRSRADGRGGVSVRARYRFNSRGLGGGPGVYFRDASRRHPKLRFVVSWIYPDEAIGEVGQQEFVGGKLVRDEAHYLWESPVRFRKIARRWLWWELPEGYPNHVA